MIVSNISGVRLLPLFQSTLAYIKSRHADSDAWPFAKAPGFQIVLDTTDTVVVTLVNNATNASSAVTATAADLTHRGVVYKTHTVAESTVAKGAYFYKVVAGSKTYYSPIFNVTCAYDYEFQYSHSCSNVQTGLADTVNKFQVQEAIIVADGKEGDRRSQKLADGSLKVNSSHVRTVWRLEIKASRAVYERLQHIDEFDTVKIKAFDTVYNIKPHTFKVEGNQPTQRTMVLAASFQLDYDDEITSCACPGFVEGGATGNGSGGEADEACPNLIVSIDASSTPDLTAVVSGTPVTPIVKKWYKNGVFYSTADTITMGADSATYELRVKVDGCFEKTAAHTYVNECTAFKIIPTVVGATLTVNYESPPVGSTPTVEVKNSDGTVVASSLPYTPTESDNYVLEVTAGDCFKTETVYINAAAANSCSHTASIDVVGAEYQGILGNPPSGAFTASYEWLRVTPDNLLATVSTAQNFTPSETGFYYFRASIGGCMVESEGKLFVGVQQIQITHPITVINDDRWRYQVFNLASDGFDGSSKTVTITRGILPDVSLFTGTPEEIAEKVDEVVKVHLNQNKLNYKNPTTYVSEYTIDPVAQTLTVHNNLGQWDVLSIFFKQDV